MKMNSSAPKSSVFLLLGALLVTIPPSLSRGADASDDSLATQEQTLDQNSKRAGYEADLKEKYGLTDDQLKALHEKGMNNSQITIAAALAKASGKSVEDVEKMRVDQKMGWGKIAKELGVHPGEIGQSISAMHNERESKVEARKAREDRRADRQERRAERKQDRAERKNQKNKS